MSERWMVRVDTDKCGLCEVCAQHCPTGALRTEREGATLRLVFSPDRCDGCPGVEDCQTRCTEGALRRTPAETEVGQAASLVLVESDLVVCARCGAAFASSRKLRAVSRRAEHTTVDRQHCPLCRQTQLVVKFIDERRRPDARAEYRSAREILQRAGHWIDKKQR